MLKSFKETSVLCDLFSEFQFQREYFPHVSEKHIVLCLQSTRSNNIHLFFVTQYTFLYLNRGDICILLNYALQEYTVFVLQEA